MLKQKDSWRKPSNEEMTLGINRLQGGNRCNETYFHGACIVEALLFNTWENNDYKTI